MEEREGAVTMGGKPVTLVGKEIKEGDKAPAFKAQGMDLSEFSFPKECKGKVCVIVAVPSLDTSVCNVEARRFDREAQALGDGVKVVVISEDLPFAQKRWCADAGVNNIRVVSDHLDASFGKKYGVLMKGHRLLARSIYVVDRKGVVRYRQLVPEQGNEPDYDKALEVARQLSTE